MNRLNLSSVRPLPCEMSLQDDPKLWYGIGILYDRYGSLDHAEEAFASVLRMNKGTCVISPASGYIRPDPTSCRFRL